MVPELGHLALTLALACAAVQSVLPIWGAARGDVAWMRSGRATAVVQAVLCAIAFGALMHAFVISDFTVLNVAENSHSAKPMIFKIAGTWGSHEGSLLLWTLILALFGAGVALLGGHIPLTLRARTLSVQAWISLGFLSFMLFTSNPFDRIFPAPLDGRDLNPLLQDIGLALHPPLLYLGYVGFSIVFSFAVAALIEGRVDPAWARWVRPWALAAWLALTGGIALGSWWAYYELGWGGWWFWDPVENVSFMPWLLGTALLHSAIVTEKRDAFKSWTILLAILTFSLSLLGTFIVRSGLLTSVHAFAVDPERGLYILGLLVVAIGGSLTLYAVRAPKLNAGGLFKPVSREGGLLVNNLALAVATATVLFGTLYPLFLEGITGEKISVGPPYFNATFLPIMLPLVAVMAIGPFMPWKRADLAGIASRMKLVAALAFAVALIAWWMETDGPVLAVLSFGLAAWLLFATIREWALRLKLGEAPLSESARRARSLPRASWGMSFAHAGLAVAMMGMIGSSAWKDEAVVFADVGDTITVGDYTLRMDDLRETRGPNWVAETATFTASENGRDVAVLRPERRFYPVAQTPTTESAIHATRSFGDLYVTIGTPPEEGRGRTVRALYEPLVNLIWLGAAMMVLGGALSLSDRRLRVGAPRRSGAPVTAVPAE